MEQDEKRKNDWKNETKEQNKQALKIRFEKYVIRKEGCWDWNASKNYQGYGTMRHRGKPIKAHRASWILHFEEIPKEKWVLHKCDNPCCSNPDHLFLGNQTDNMRDMAKKGRTKIKPKLTYEQVEEIRKLLAEGIKMNKISKKYNVSATAIWEIKHGKSWKHVRPNC